MTDKEKLEKIKALADKMYSRMAYLTSDTRPIRQAMDEYNQFIINEYHKEEPVSEDLDEAGKEWLRPQLDKSYANYGEAKMMELTHFDGYSMLEAIEFGAKWKEEQFEKNRLEHCNSITNEQAELEQGFIDQHLDKHDRMPTFLDAIEYGMRLQKEQLMKGAFEFTRKHNDACVLASECLRDHGWFNREHDFNDLFLYLSCVDELFAGKFSEKTKVIVIKED